ncbi:potassium channel family protein [Auraticoccus monumenti]|uniref:Ion channel n=1 Tax=Auraticoccus monumenti TaxID=675864 RepID=A0A1G7BUE9_9ACTN|nr:potassium channel family protein [Auraticoccus monumenti]SDE30592.1 Ion channel [Auraticoccus monumenti]
MDVLLTVLGLLVVLVGLRDIYHGLLHPSGKGALARGLISGVWWVSKRLGHRLGSAVGPAAMVAVVVLWIALQALGWALVYLPHVPEGFVYSTGFDPARQPAFFDAVYVSLVALATLGFGDVVATAPWPRMAAPLQALTGFALLTAALTWFTQVYPPLARRRALALRLKGLADTGYVAGLGAYEPALVGQLVDSLTDEVLRARVDLTQHSESYYFQEQDPDLSLASQLPEAVALQEVAATSPSPALRAGAARLGAALEQLAGTLRADFVRAPEGVEATFAAYASDHARDPRRVR